jgi:hypothetical protein
MLRRMEIRSTTTVGVTFQNFDCQTNDTTLGKRLTPWPPTHLAGEMLTIHL